MYIVDDQGKRWNLVKMDFNQFTVRQKKSEEAYKLTPHREGWDDPGSDEIDRIYKGIKIGADSYAYELHKEV